MSALSHRGKPRTEFYGNRATQKEPSCLDSYDFCDPLRLEWRRQSIDNATEQIGVQENAPDISMAVDLGNLLIQRGCQLDVEATPPELVPDVCREFADPTPSARPAGRMLTLLAPPGMNEQVVDAQLMRSMHGSGSAVRGFRPRPQSGRGARSRPARRRVALSIARRPGSARSAPCRSARIGSSGTAPRAGAHPRSSRPAVA